MTAQKNVEKRRLCVPFILLLLSGKSSCNLIKLACNLENISCVLLKKQLFALSDSSAVTFTKAQWIKNKVTFYKRKMTWSFVTSQNDSLDRIRILQTFFLMIL